VTGSGATEMTGPYSNIDSNYPPNFQTSFPLPCVALNPNPGQDNFVAITTSYLPLQPLTSMPSMTSLPLVPTTGTDISDSLNQAISIVNSSTYARPTAKKAIILFTDGIPNYPSDPNTGSQDAIAQAQQAGACSPPIPIYTIGLSQNPFILPEENQLLGDGISTPQGIAYFSSPGVAKYYSVQNPADIEQAFQQVARSLCVIQ